MVIMVMSFCTFVFAQSVENRIVGRGYGVYDAFLNKSLQCTVYGYPVEAGTAFLFNISMRERPVLL